MKAIKTDKSNHSFSPPPGREDVIDDLPCQLMPTQEAWGHNGGTVVFSVWELNQSERDAIANGQNIKLGVGWTGSFPPVSVGITHERRVDETDD